MGVGVLTLKATQLWVELLVALSLTVEIRRVQIIITVVIIILGLVLVLNHGTHHVKKKGSDFRVLFEEF